MQRSMLYTNGESRFCFWFHLVRGTSSLWSSVTDEDLLSTEGVKVTKESVLLVGEQVKSEPDGLLAIPLE